MIQGNEFNSGGGSMTFWYGSNGTIRFFSITRPDSNMLGLLKTKVRYTVINTKAVQGRSALAVIGSKLWSEVPTGVAILYEFAHDSSYNVDDDF